jgi:hypothetical protein
MAYSEHLSALESAGHICIHLPGLSYGGLEKTMPLGSRMWQKPSAIYGLLPKRKSQTNFGEVKDKRCQLLER